MDHDKQKRQYEDDLMEWKTSHLLNQYARMPDKPKCRKGMDPMKYANLLFWWNKMKSLWDTAPKAEDYGLCQSTYSEIRIEHILKFGAQHVRLFDFRLMSELDRFEEFLFKNGFRYRYVERQDGSAEINIDSCYDFVFSEESAKFKLTIESSDGVHLTGFYFYNDNGYKDKHQRSNTIADIHDFFMKDSRVVTKKIKAGKNDCGCIQDYIATYEAARVEDSSVFITTIEKYKKLPKYRWPIFSNNWIAYTLIVLIYAIPIGYGLFGTEEEGSDSIDTFYTSEGMVYICTGHQALTYHKDENCHGLQSCSSEIKEISINEAKDQGKHPCKYCYDHR